jgi:hypothetical protein
MERTERERLQSLWPPGYETLEDKGRHLAYASKVVAAVGLSCAALGASEIPEGKWSLVGASTLAAANIIRISIGMARDARRMLEADETVEA